MKRQREQQRKMTNTWRVGVDILSDERFGTLKLHFKILEHFQHPFGALELLLRGIFNKVLHAGKPALLLHLSVFIIILTAAIHRVVGG